MIGNARCGICRSGQKNQTISLPKEFKKIILYIINIMKTLRVDLLHRHSSDSLPYNKLEYRTYTHLLCESGPFEAQEGNLYVKIIERAPFPDIAVPCDHEGNELIVENTNRMFGGSFIHTSDALFNEFFKPSERGLRFSHPIALHDRFEPVYTGNNVDWHEDQI